jgi:hypothetical protein
MTTLTEKSMQAITRFSIVKVDAHAESCVLARDGSALSVTFAGTVLEAQFALDGAESLLILSDADPYDAGLHIYLLNSAGEIIDALEGGGAFQPGVFRLHATLASALRFEFFTNDVIYQLTVAPQAEVHFIAASGWRYKNKLKLHRFTIVALGGANEKAA